MQAKSKSFRTAVVGSPRRIEILTVVDISDPDIRYGAFRRQHCTWSNPGRSCVTRFRSSRPICNTGTGKVDSGSVLSDISERLSGFGADRTQQ